MVGVAWSRVGLVAVSGATTLGAGACKADVVPIRVAAAATLTNAFEELAREFTRKTGRDVVLTFGASGLLSRQLGQGAPYDLFAAADLGFVDQAIASGACDGATRAIYARGRVAVWTRKGERAITDLNELRAERFRHIAIANPEHAPYGRAARQALERLSLWEPLAPRLVFADNVRQALQLAETGNADAAFVSEGLVANDHDNPWLLVPDTLHQPIEQGLVACDGGADKQGGLAFSRFLTSPEGRAIMGRHGFSWPAVP